MTWSTPRPVAPDDLNVKRQSSEVPTISTTDEIMEQQASEEPPWLVPAVKPCEVDVLRRVKFGTMRRVAQKGGKDKKSHAQDRNMKEKEVAYGRHARGCLPGHSGIWFL